jgi:hypothetical protein
MVGWRRIVGRRWARLGRLAAEIMVTGGTGPCFGGNKIGGIAVSVQYHVTSVVVDDGVRMGGAVI